MLLKDSLGALPLLPALQTVELGGEYLYSYNIRIALRDFVEGLSRFSHRSLPMLILPDAEGATFLQPYVEKIESSKGTWDSSLSALPGYEGFYGENNYDEGTTEDESDGLEDEDDYEGESDAFGGPCLCRDCNDPYDDEDVYEDMYEDEDEDEDEDDYEVTAEDLMV